MSEWISVKDRLPEKNARVWAHFKASAEHSGVSWKRDGENVAVWWGDRWAPWSIHDAEAHLDADVAEVTHWMPLPEPPDDRT